MFFNKDQLFEMAILTPSTKAEYGLHDEPIARNDIVNGVVEEEIYAKAEAFALKLFACGQAWASQQGLILVDTKYEFGIVNNELIVIDEIHTPDSSRYWIASEYEDRFNAGENQKMLDKENIRKWLIDRGFSGEGTPPTLTDEIRITLAERYIDLYNQLIGRQFNPVVGDVKTRIETNLEKAGIYA